jgi:tetratricopeptide (TPR) repeat protein
MEKYDQAIADLNEALMITPESPIAFLNRAIAFKEKKQYVKALEDCNKALELNNFFKRAIAQRGLILYEMGWFDKALNDFNEVIKLDPENPRYYYYRALAQYQRNDIEATLQDYQKVISLNPTNALTYYNRAILYTQLNDYDKAIEDYDQVARLNPNNILTYFNRAHLYYETKMYQKAIDDYTKAIALFPKFATAYFMRAQARAQSGDRKGAAQDRQAGQQLVAQHDRQKAEKNHPMAWIDSTYFQKIIEFEADFNRSSVALVSGNKTESHIQPKALFRFAYLPRQHHDKKGMIDSFISQFNLNDTIGQRMILWNLNPETRFEQLNEARKKIDSLVTISAPNANLYLLQGAVERELQNYTSAINSFSLAMLANPNFIPAYINRAETAYTMKKEQEQNQQDIRHISLGAANSIPSPPAKQDYTKVYLDLNKAIALDNQKAITWYNRGNVSLNEKKYTDAVIDYSQALSCDNDFAEAYFNRGLTLIFLQDREKGCLDMSRAGELGIEDAYEVIRRFCK